MKINERTIEKLLSKDEETFDEIYNKLFRLVKHVSYKITKNLSLSEDICQETFIKMLAKINTHKVGSNFKYWVLQIAKNIAYDYMREEKFMNEYKNSILVNSSEKNLSNDLHTDEHELLKHINKVLDEQAYEIIILRFYHGLKFREIADILEVSTATVTSKYTRSMKILKESTKKEKIL